MNMDITQEYYDSLLERIRLYNKQMDEKSKKKMNNEPIYERLAPGEVLIMCRREDGSLDVAENRNGGITIRNVSIPQTPNDDDMERISKSGVLPMIITSNTDIIEEVIICDSISGGADYKNEMPVSLGLVRTLKDGTEYKCRYVQVTTV